VKPDQILEALVDLAQKLDVNVSEERFARGDVAVKSGACVVGSQKRVILDRRLDTRQKIEILASYLSRLAHEDIYVVPLVRDVLALYRDDSQKFT